MAGELVEKKKKTNAGGIFLSQQAKPTHQNIIRLAPPLVISEKEIQDALRIIEAAVQELPGLKGETEHNVVPPPEKKVKVDVEN